MKGQCPGFDLVPTLLLYVEHRLSYYLFTMYTHIIQNRIMGCHGNGAISHNQNSFFSSGRNISHLVGPCEPFGAHGKLSRERTAR